VGTNSTKLLIARTNDFLEIETICYQRKITRLGEGLKERGRLLNPDAINRTCDAVKEYFKLANEKGVREVAVIGTHVLRAAKNPLDFIEKVRIITGLEVQVISGALEAAATKEGALLNYGSKPDRNIVIVDIGGGSTEIVRGAGSCSLPLGAVSLTEMIFNEDPPKKIQMIKALLRFRDLLLGNVKFLVPGDRVNFIGVGGTITSTAALSLGLDEYDPSLIDGYNLDEKQIIKILDRLSSVTLEQRKQLMQFDPDRSDVIIAGMLILSIFFRYFHVESFRVSIKNVIHGIFFRKFRKNFNK